jgi:hypothetical protein
MRKPDKDVKETKKKPKERAEDRETKRNESPLDLDAVFY